MFLGLTVPVVCITPNPDLDSLACEMLAAALRRSNVSVKDVTSALDIDAPRWTRWTNGERPNPMSWLLRLPLEMQQELVEQWGPVVGVTVLTRAFVACLSQLLHGRPRQLRALAQAGERGRHVA